MSERPILAQDYAVRRDGLSIDGREFSWAIGIEGPKVEAIDEYHHWLWVPIIVMKPAPGHWDDRGESALPDTTALATARAAVHTTTKEVI